MPVTTQSSVSPALSQLPGYIETRTRLAAEAGLVTEKVARRGAMLTTRYSGTEAQFRASRFVRIPHAFAFPRRVGSRKRAALGVFSPAVAAAELKCTLVKTGEDRYRLSISNERLPAASRNLAGRIAVYKYTELPEGANAGPATVYVGALSSLVAAGIAPPETARGARRGAAEGGTPALWHAEPLEDGRHRFVVYHEAEARARAQDEERGRSNFRTPDQYHDWLLEVVAASIGMIRRQLRTKTRQRYVYTVPARTLKDLEAQFAKLRRTVARAEIVVQKEDVRAETQRAEMRRAALAALRDADFQRFLGRVVAVPPSTRER
jgi:hypothetical protein